MGKELAKAYEPHEVEERIYEFWMNGKYFHAEVDSKKKPYTIVIPPPNITGQLHMGHALDETLQDILIRFRRMQGYSALWLPGTDHASIATEAKIVEAMKQEGKGIILISEELPELLGMSDRILIMKDGGIQTEFIRSSELKDTEVIQYMI